MKFRHNPCYIKNGMTSKELIQKVCDLPPVPMVAFRVLNLINNEANVMLDDLQKVITADQALTARMLKVANSALYAGRQNIDTITQAVTILGLKSVKIITLAASTREVYKHFGIVEQKLWEHNLGVSIAAGIISEDIPFLKKEEAVVAGLLHDIGKVVMNNGQPDKFSLLTQAVYVNRKPYASIEQDIFGFSHAEVGSFLTEKWGFPEILCKTICKHHVWSSEGITLDPYAASLCATVALADSICVKLGVGYREPMPDMNLGEEQLRMKLGIKEERFSEIIAIFRNAYVLEKASYL